MSDRPAGVELRRWFTYLVALLIFVNITTVTISILINRAVHGVVAEYQPFAQASSEIEQHVTAVQRDMYTYLYTGAGAKNPALAEQQLTAIGVETDALLARIAKAREITTESANLKSLDEIASKTQQYRNTIDALAYAIGDTVNFNLLTDLLTQANKSGEEVAESAAALQKAARQEIMARNSRASTLTSFAMWLFIVVMGASIGVLLALKHWWAKFQEIMLGI
jgi:hypothetical protein